MRRSGLVPLFSVLFCEAGDYAQTGRVSMEKTSRVARIGLGSLQQFPSYIKKSRKPISKCEISFDFGFQRTASFRHHLAAGEKELGIAD